MVMTILIIREVKLEYFLLQIYILSNTINGLMCTSRASCYSTRLSWVLVLAWVSPFAEGRKEMFYLTTHSTHFIYSYMASDIMVKDHSDSEKGNPLSPHRLLISINSKGSFICTIPQTG